MGLHEPSRFWERLALQHERDLSEFGPDQFKRHQALRYFTWRWSWRALLRSEQFRFLLSHTSPRTWKRCASAPIDLGDAAWEGTAWSRPDRWLYAFAVRLLWSYAREHDTAGVLDLPEPELGRPFPVHWEGRLISQDLANSALEAAALRRALDGREPRSVLEVGAGYGRTAYALLHVFPEATYTIVDIEPAIAISRWYLSQLFPASRLRFLSPAEARCLPEASVDLVLSISSLQEMTQSQVTDYLRLFDSVAAGGTVFLKQWARWHNPTDEVTMRFDDYAVPARWCRRFRERAPVQTRFVQAAWRVPGPSDDEEPGGSL